MSFSSNLRKAMDENGVTQTELAELIGKGKSSVSQYISGKNIPRTDIQEKIAEVLSCSVEWLNQDVTEPINGDLKNVPVEVAAKRLGVCPQSVRISLQQGTAPYGYAWKTKTKWSYHISLKKLDDYIGKDVAENISNE